MSKFLMQLLGLLFIGYIFWAFQVKPIKADSFGIHKDAYYCHFIPVVGIFYDRNSLNTISNGIKFDMSQVQGLPDSYIASYAIHNLANIYANNVSRYNKALSVKLPPGTRIKLGLWAYNYAGHNVNIKKVFIPLTLINHNEVLGDITRLVNFNYINKHIVYRNRNKQLYRSGKFMELVPTQKLYKHNVLYKGQELGNWTLIQPIKIKKVESECILKRSGEQQVVEHFTLQNVGAYNEHIRVDSFNYFIPEGVTHNITVIKSIDKGKQTVATSLKEIKIVDSKTECASLSNPDVFINNPKYKQVFVLRDDLSYNNTFQGIQPGLTNNHYGYKPTFCVTRIPYVLQVRVPGCTFPHNAEIQVKQQNCIMINNKSIVSVIIKNKGIELQNVVIDLSLQGVNLARPNALPVGVELLQYNYNYVRLRIQKVPALDQITLPLFVAGQNNINHTDKARILARLIGPSNVTLGVTSINLTKCNINADIDLHGGVSCKSLPGNKNGVHENLRNGPGKNIYEVLLTSKYTIDYKDYGGVQLKQAGIKFDFACSQIGRVYDQRVFLYLKFCYKGNCKKYLVPKSNLSISNGAIQIKWQNIASQLGMELVDSIQALIEIRQGFTGVSGNQAVECTIVGGPQGYTVFNKASLNVPECYTDINSQISDNIELGNLIKLAKRKILPVKLFQGGKDTFLVDDLIGKVGNIEGHLDNSRLNNLQAVTVSATTPVNNTKGRQVQASNNAKQGYIRSPNNRFTIWNRFVQVFGLNTLIFLLKVSALALLIAFLINIIIRVYNV